MSVEYQHRLNTRLVAGLALLAEAGGGPTKLNELSGDMREFALLRHWDLATKVKRGEWEITDKGWSFLLGYRRVRNRVVTLESSRVRFEGDLVSVADAIPDYDQQDWYAAGGPT